MDSQKGGLHAPNSLAGVVVDLSTLRGARDAAHGANVEDVSGLGRDLLGSGEEGEEGKRGKVVRGGVDAVGLRPALKGLVLEHGLGDALGGLLAVVNLGRTLRDTVVVDEEVDVGLLLGNGVTEL